MPDTSISALTAAAALDGTEVLPLAQAAGTFRTTAQEIADLASVTSAMVDTLSNAVSALEVRVSTLSASPGGGVTTDQLSAAVGVSVLATGLVSVKGLQSVVNTLSDRVSGAFDLAAAAEVHASTASAAATSVNSRCTSINTFICAGVSAHTTAGVSIKGLQSVVDAMSNRISAVTGGAGLTSDQTSAMIHSVLSTQYSARTSVGGATSVKGLQSVIDALSVELVNEVSIRAVSVQTASAAAQAAEVHASTASAAATSVDTRVNALSQTLSAVSALSVGVAANGLQSAVNALSNTISAVSAAVTSVDTRVNTVSNLVSQHTVSLAQLSNAVSLLNAVSTVSAAGTAVGLQSVINAMSNRISAIVGGAGMTSDQTSAMLASVLGTVSCRAFSALGTAQTSVKGLQSVIDRLSNTFSNAFSAGSVVSCVSAAGTAVGLQSVVNALSARIVAGASATSAEVQTASAAATSVDSRVNSINTYICATVSCVSAAGTAVGLQSVVNALSASLASAEVHASAASAAATSVNGRVTSVNNLWTSGLGTTVGIGINTNGVVMTGNSFTNVSGLAVALAASGDYQIDGRVFFTLSILTGTRFGFSYNGSGNGQMVKGAMDMHCTTSVIAAAISNLVSTNFSYGHINEAAMSNVATVNISIAGGASATTHMLLIEGMLQNGASAVTLNLQAAHSAASGGINILAGSYIRAYRIV